MSALIRNSLNIEIAKAIVTWPTKDFPNNAIITAAGIASYVALHQILNISYYYTIILTSLIVTGVKLNQMDKEAQQKQVIDSKIAKIFEKIYKLEGFEKNNLPMAKQLLELGRETIEPLFNQINTDQYAKTKILANNCGVKMPEFANIWNKFPDFNDDSYKKRCDLFTDLLEGEYKVYFQNLKG